MSGKKDKKSINLVGKSSPSRKRKVKSKARRRTKARLGGAVRKTARSRR
jgi:hypothetical protein